MKHILYFVFFGILLTSLPSVAQRDRIITQAGQEIRCKILEESPSRFNYAYVDAKGQVRQSQIFKTLVKSFAYQVYNDDISKDKIFQSPKSTPEVSRFEAPKPKSAAAVPAPQKQVMPPAPRKEEPVRAPKPPRSIDTPLTGWQVGVRGGLTNFIDPLTGFSETSLPYYEDLARAYSVGAEVHYFPTQFLGIGLIALGTQSKATGREVQYYNGFSNNYLVNDIQTTRQLGYLGPSIQFRHVLDPKALVYTRLSGGRFFQKDQGFYAETPYEGKGQNWAGSAAVGFDFLLGQGGIALNLEASYTYAQQKQMNFGEGLQTLPSPLDLPHFSITLGLKWMQRP